MWSNTCYVDLFVFYNACWWAARSAPESGSKITKDRVLQLGSSVNNAESGADKKSPCVTHPSTVREETWTHGAEMETIWWPPKCIFSFETEVKTCHVYECTVFLDQQCLFFLSRGIPLLINSRAHARSRLNPRSTRWNIDQKLSASSCHESAAPVGYSGHFFLIALVSQTEMKWPTVKKK